MNNDHKRKKCNLLQKSDFGILSFLAKEIVGGIPLHQLLVTFLNFQL